MNNLQVTLLHIKTNSIKCDSKHNTEVGTRLGRSLPKFKEINVQMGDKRKLKQHKVL